MDEVKIEAIAFSMWLSKNLGQGIRGPNNTYLMYWDYWDIWLTHETRQTYIDHVRKQFKS